MELIDGTLRLGVHVFSDAYKAAQAVGRRHWARSRGCDRHVPARTFNTAPEMQERPAAMNRCSVQDYQQAVTTLQVGIQSHYHMFSNA